MRPRLSPAIADVRRMVRGALRDAISDVVTDVSPDATTVLPRPLVLVGLSGGADSLALAAATAFEAPRIGLRAGAVIIDHSLQARSADVAATASAQAQSLGLDPVLIRRVDVAGESPGGPEAAARTVRYRAFAETMADTGAGHVLLGHTLDDQAETVLLGLARGSGPVSLQGMAAHNGPYLRPLLGIRRVTTEQFCRDSGLEPWNDPHNTDPAFTRVRVRQTVLPMLDRELGPGIAEALARTAVNLREDAAALEALALRRLREVAAGSGTTALEVLPLADEPPAVVHRVIRMLVNEAFGLNLSRTQTLAVAALITDWHGQKEVHLPGVRVVRATNRLVFTPILAAPDR